MLRLVLKDGYGAYAPVNFLEKLSLFQGRPELLKNDKYLVKSDASLQVLDVFLTRVLGNPSPSGVTNENIRSLKALCDEFGFDGFDSEFETGASESASLRRGDLKDRLDAHDVVIDRLERQMLALGRHNEMLQHALEQVIREVSRESRVGLETIGNAIHGEMRNCDVDQWGSAVDEHLKDGKREISSVKDENGKLARDFPRSMEVCEKHVSCQRDEVSLLNGCESRVSPDSKPEEVQVLWRAAVNTRVFSWMREREASLTRKLVVVKKSSNDIYGWLDPDASDAYGGGSNPGAWIEIEFKAPVRVNGLKVISSSHGHHPKTFDVTFSDGPGSSAKHKVSFVDELGLNGKNLSVQREFDAITAKLVRIESRGPNWSGNHVFNLGGIELFSPDEAHAGGVFRSIFARDHDRVWDFFDVRARDGDGSDLHTPNGNNISTWSGEREWVEVGFLYGRVVLSGYRIQKHQDHLRDWSLRASNDRNVPVEEWLVLHRHREATEAEKTSAVLTFECASPTPFRFFRVVQEGKNWKGRLQLVLKYFDIDGEFIPD